MLLAEDLLLLLTDDETGALQVSTSEADVALAGALLVELTLQGRVGMTGEGEGSKPGRLAVPSEAPTGEPLLDSALQTVAAHAGQKPGKALQKLGKDLRRTLFDRLTGRGVVRAERGRILGIFPTDRWPAVDGRRERDVRADLARSLVERVEPDERTAALVGLLHALGCEHKVIDPRPHGMSKRDLRARAKEIAEGSWASEAVHKTVEELRAAVVAIAAGAAIAGATFSGSS